MMSRSFHPHPNVPLELPEIRSEDEQYIVQAGDTLGNHCSAIWNYCANADRGESNTQPRPA